MSQLMAHWFEQPAEVGHRGGESTVEMLRIGDVAAPLATLLPTAVTDVDPAIEAGFRSNPEAYPGAPDPRIGVHPVNGTVLYAEVRGAGPAVLLVPGGAEDAEGWGPVAERLTGRTVVTYDRRGTLRSGTDDWPGGGSAQHADDAAGLLHALRLRDGRRNRLLDQDRNAASDHL